MSTSFRQRVASRLHTSKRIVILIVVVVLITLLTSTLVSVMLYRVAKVYIPSAGNLKTLGVRAFWDEDLRNEVTTIQWGTTYSGSTNNVTFFLQSISSDNSFLEMNTTNWTFRNLTSVVSAPLNTSQYMNLTWDYNGSFLKSLDKLRVTLTLFVSDSWYFVLFIVNNGIREFAFDITIRAVEV